VGGPRTGGAHPFPAAEDTLLETLNATETGLRRVSHKPGFCSCTDQAPLVKVQ
jgi:hypothetical protein